jgi:phosphomethylpyrimidine synthase
MRITQDLRDYAASHGLGETAAIETGMEAKAAEFRAAGQELYVARQSR